MTRTASSPACCSTSSTISTACCSSTAPRPSSTSSSRHRMPQKPYKIVFFGTSDFAVPILERLRGDGDFSVVEVVTQPDRPVGRKRLLTSPAVKRAAETYGLKTYQPESIKGDEALAHFKGLGADAFVVVSYGKILPKALLELPP